VGEGKSGCKRERERERERGREGGRERESVCHKEKSTVGLSVAFTTNASLAFTMFVSWRKRICE